MKLHFIGQFVWGFTTIGHFSNVLQAPRIKVTLLVL